MDCFFADDLNYFVPSKADCICAMYTNTCSGLQNLFCRSLRPIGLFCHLIKLRGRFKAKRMANGSDPAQIGTIGYGFYSGGVRGLSRTTSHEAGCEFHLRM